MANQIKALATLWGGLEFDSADPLKEQETDSKFFDLHTCIHAYMYTHKKKLFLMIPELFQAYPHKLSVSSSALNPTTL